MHLKVEVLLDVNQIWTEYPAVSTLYTDPESVLVHGPDDIRVEQVLAKIDPPSIILTLDPTSRTLHQLTVSVSF